MRACSTLIVLLVSANSVLADVWVFRPPKQKASVWAITSSQPSVTPKSAKTCPCSNQCACGCNAGKECDCNKPRQVEGSPYRIVQQAESWSCTVGGG